MPKLDAAAIANLPADLKDRLRVSPAGSPELALQVMAWLADRGRVVEIGANNYGPWPKRFLTFLGLREGNPWCLAAMNWALALAGCWTPNTGRVHTAVALAHRAGRIRTKPVRGLLCARLNPDTSGHIGIVAKVHEDGSMDTIEGNTSSGGRGSQRDGDGLYRRHRPKGYFTVFIEPGL